jgi:SAM-dependent methyltransferase
MAQMWERLYQTHKELCLDAAVAHGKRIVACLPSTAVEIRPSTRVLDMGCGASGILLALDQGIRTGIDPLMDHYRRIYPFLDGYPIMWQARTAEAYQPKERFDVVFSINSLDHMQDPRAAADSIVALLAPGGCVVLLVNAHRSRRVRGYFAWCYPFVDPPHPHQFHEDDVPRLFPSLNEIHREDVDHHWLAVERAFALSSGGGRRLAVLRTVVDVLNPFQLPLTAARVLARRPLHRAKETDEPLMVAMLYVLR